MIHNLTSFLKRLGGGGCLYFHERSTELLKKLRHQVASLRIQVCSTRPVCAGLKEVMLEKERLIKREGQKDQKRENLSRLGVTGAGFGQTESFLHADETTKYPGSGLLTESRAHL